MKLIFIGLIFIMLELNIGINLLPDFVGYLLIAKACGDWAKESKKMAAVRPVALAMAGVTAVIFVMRLILFLPSSPSFERRSSAGIATAKS